MTAKDRVFSLLSVYARIAKGAGNTEEQLIWDSLIDYLKSEVKAE